MQQQFGSNRLNLMMIGGCVEFSYGTDRDYFLDNSMPKILSLVTLSTIFLAMKWQKIVLSPSFNIGADAKIVPDVVLNLAKV